MKKKGKGKGFAIRIKKVYTVTLGNNVAYGIWAYGRAGDILSWSAAPRHPGKPLVICCHDEPLLAVIVRLVANLYTRALVNSRLKPYFMQIRRFNPPLFDEFLITVESKTAYSRIRLNSWSLPSGHYLCFTSHLVIKWSSEMSTQLSSALH